MIKNPQHKVKSFYGPQLEKFGNTAVDQTTKKRSRKFRREMK